MAFNHSAGGLDLSAVYLDMESSYMAEDTSFHGFDGEVRYRGASLCACCVCRLWEHEGVKLPPPLHCLNGHLLFLFVLVEETTVRSLVLKNSPPFTHRHAFTGGCPNT